MIDNGFELYEEDGTKKWITRRPISSIGEFRDVMVGKKVKMNCLEMFAEWIVLISEITAVIRFEDCIEIRADVLKKHENAHHKHEWEI